MPAIQHHDEARQHVIYLRDGSGKTYAKVHASLGEVPRRGWPAEPATKLKHRKNGMEYTVAAVDTMTRQLRCEEDVNPDGEPLRSRWYSVDEFDIVDMPTDPEQAKRELESLRSREAELQKMIAASEKPAPQPALGAPTVGSEKKK